MLCRFSHTKHCEQWKKSSLLNLTAPKKPPTSHNFKAYKQIISVLCAISHANNQSNTPINHFLCDRCSIFDSVKADVTFEACRRALCVCLCVNVSPSGGEKTGTINRAEILNADVEYMTACAWVCNIHHQKRARVTFFTVKLTVLK